MLLTRRKPDIVKGLEKLTKHIKSDLGKKPIALVDTSFIIDLERIREQKVKGKDYSTDMVYGVFSDRNIPLFVTSEIREEVTKHHFNHYRNHRNNPEISNETYDKVVKMHKAWIEFLAHGFPSRDLEQTRLDVYLSQCEVFEEGHKKREIDKISRADRELVSAALWVKGHCADTFNLESPSGVAVLSTDSHVLNSIEFLKSNHVDNPYRDVKGYSIRR